MQLKLAKPVFLTFSKLTARWGYSAAYMHELIRTGKIVPAIALIDQERYVGGEFRGGYSVGDVDNARHHSYAEYYVGTVIGDDDHYESRPQCGRLMYCHCPVDEANGHYSFQFLSNSPCPGDADIWFYLDHGAQIGCGDGEGRFRFEWPEINRFEGKNSTSDEGGECPQPVVGVPLPLTAEAATSQPAVQPRAVQYGSKGRNHVLDAEITEAQRNALNPDDANSVWVELLKMAERRQGCLVGVGEGEVKYEREGEIKWLKRKDFADRLSRRRKRANAR